MVSTNIIFLDIDGVLNCQTFYDRVGFEGPERERNMCSHRIEWLNELCRDTDAKVVITSTWRLGRSVEEIRGLFGEAGATFHIIDKTDNLRHEACVRGNEIYQWIKENSETLFGVAYFRFKTYAIIDDDSDMLLWQAPHFFKVDHYSGLTPNTCYEINLFFQQVKNIDKSK